MDHNDHDHSKTTDPTGPGGYMKLAGIEDGEYDALADLFLGESELAPEPFSQTGTDSVEPLNTAPVRFRSPDDEPKIPALPVEVMPRLGRAESASTFEPKTRRTPCIEAVLLGHLPVRASLWVRQYACSAAKRRGEIVALIRAAAGSTSIDLISGEQMIESAECGSLHDALARVNELADRVILRVDETTEPELLDREGVDEITILTGADETAVVASYRLIKTLTSMWDADEIDDQVVGIPHLRLAVMGATGQQVADASAKLSRAVDAFLDRPIEIIDAAGRIDATGTTNIFRDTVAHQAMDILDDLMESQDGSSSPMAINPVTNNPVTIEFAKAQGPQIHVDKPTILPTVQAGQTPPAKSAVRAPVDNGLGSLIQGLIRLETRCPFALDVELCVDAAGSLHLVADDTHDGPMARLETVRAWVRDHLPLILRAESRLAVPDANDRSSEIGLHLITTDPQSLRGLIDSPVRMYALAEVTIGEQTARVATAIN